MQLLGGGKYPSNGATPDQSSRFAGDFDENVQCDPAPGTVTSYQLYCNYRLTMWLSDLDGGFQHEIAWAEGWADFFALRAIGGGSVIIFQRSHDDPNCPDCTWTVDLEPTLNKWGHKVEFNVAGSLNDMLDTLSDHLDSVSMSASDIWNPFRAKYAPNFSAYWAQFKSTFSTDVNKIQGANLAIYNNHVDFQADLRLTQDPDASATPVVAVEGSNSHVVWVDGRDGNNEIYYKKVDINWNVIVSDTRLSKNRKDSVSPALAVGPSGRLDVLWSDNRNGNYEIYLRTYTTSSGWGAETRLTSTSPDSREPDVAFDSSGNAQYVWREVERTPSAETETVLYSKNGGAATTLFSYVGAPFTNTHNDRVSGPGITTGGTNYLHVVWSRGPAWPVEGGITYMYYRRWNGNAWESTVTLGTDQDAARRIRVDAAAWKVMVVWDQWQDGFDISYRISNDYGVSWTTESVITQAGNQFSPDVTVTSYNENWYMTYSDNSAGQYEIFVFGFVTILPGYPPFFVGFTESNMTGDSLYPRIGYAASSNAFTIAWQDARDGNREIYWVAKNILTIIGQ